MQSAARTSSFVRDVVVTTFTSLATAVCLVLVTKVLARVLGAETFGVYAIARRASSLVLLFATLEMGTALPRLLAMTRSDDARGSILLAATLLPIAPATLLVLAAAAFTPQLSCLLFGSADFEAVLISATLCVATQPLFVALYGYFRGTDRMGLANASLLVVTAFGPLIVAQFCVGPGELSRYFRFLAVLQAASLLPLLPRLASVMRSKEALATLRDQALELLRYALPRTPTGLGFYGLLAAGPLLQAHFGSLKNAGFLVVGQYLPTLVESAFAAFGIVLLPRVSHSLAEGRRDLLRAPLGGLLCAILHLGAFMTIQLIVWSDTILVIWLGQDFLQANDIVRISLLSLVPLLLFGIMRSVIDAATTRPENTINVYVALFVVILLSAASLAARLGPEGLAAASTTGVTLLGALTILRVKRHGLIPDRLKVNVVAVGALNLAGLAIAVAVKMLLSTHVSAGWLFIAGVVTGVLLLLVYVFSLRVLGVEWVRMLLRRLEGYPSIPA